VNSTTVLTRTLTSGEISSTPGERFGLGYAGTGGEVQYFYVDYFTAGEENPTTRNRLAAMAGGDLYFEYTRGTLEQVGTDAQELFTGAGTLISSKERAQKLYIADRGAIIDSGTINTASEGLVTTTTFDDTAGQNWVTLGIDPDTDVVEIFDAEGSLENGVYEIASVSTTTITLAVNSLGTTDNCSFRIRRGPKVFDPTLVKGNAAAIAIWVEDQYDADDVANGLASTVLQHKGGIPLDCPIVTRYKDRMVLCKDNQWHMSRVGDPHDWDYFQADDDSSRAVAGQNSSAGDLGQEITAAIAHSDNYLIFAHTSELWVLRGDPAFGGAMSNLSRTVGCVDQFAWTYSPQKDLILLAPDGLYAIGAGVAGVPEPLSQNLLPQELLSLDKSQVHVSLTYDPNGRGIHIYLTPVTTGTKTHWWFSFQTLSFWPITIADDNVQPTRSLFYTNEFGEASAYMGCRDGYVRKQDVAYTDDDGTSFTSYAYLGPVLLGGDEDMEGMISELMCTLGEESSEVDWSIYVGDTAESALESSTVYSSGEWTAGRNVPVLKPRARGIVAFIKIANGAITPWQFERLRLQITRGGRARAL
jgi:hypothetical protein